MSRSENGRGDIGRWNERTRGTETCALLPISTSIVDGNLMSNRYVHKCLDNIDQFTRQRKQLEKVIFGGCT